jgi:hypothetical protein
MAIPAVPRRSKVLAEKGLVALDWDRWLQGVQTALNDAQTSVAALAALITAADLRFLVQHDAAGAHTDVSANSLASVLGLKSYGRTVPEGEGQDYTPVWTAVTTNPVLGNGTIAGRYSVTGTTVIAAISIVMGSTTTFGTGQWILSIPLPLQGNIHNGFGLAYDASTDIRYVLYANQASATSIFLSADAVTPGVGVATPFAWAQSDLLRATFIYEMVP